MGYSDKIVPLDKKIYSLRDVSATVGSIPLIASSIMSKISCAIRYNNIRCKSWWWCIYEEDVPSAKKLASKMITIGKGANRNTYVVLSNMDEPLGYNIGNATEVIEAIELLKR